jgi:putative PIN family toxin of toxin-antitoxin system
MPEPLTAVIDATVLVSAFLTKGGVSAELLRFAREGVFLVFLSKDILIETEHTLGYDRIRERYPYTDDDVADFLNRLRIAANLVAELPNLTVVRDPNDDMVIATAVRAHAAYIVTRDRDLLSLQQYQDITIISPEAFIAIVRDQMPFSLQIEEDTQP